MRSALCSRGSVRDGQTSRTRCRIHLKTKNLHEIARHDAASQTLLCKVMRHHTVNLRNFVQRGVNEEGQSKMIGVAICVLFIVRNISRVLKSSFTKIILEFYFHIC